MRVMIQLKEKAKNFKDCGGKKEVRGKGMLKTMDKGVVHHA